MGRWAEWTEWAAVANLGAAHTLVRPHLHHRWYGETFMTEFRGRVGMIVMLLIPASTLRGQISCDTTQAQAAIHECVEVQARWTDSLLNVLVREIGDSIGPRRAQELNQVQGVWGTFRNMNCRWDSEAVEGGSMQPAWELQCCVNLTVQRIKDLSSTLCEGGGECRASRQYADLIAQLK